MMFKVTGPDQPYCWIIAIAACIINTLLSGLTRGTGIFYVALIDVYGVSRLEANLPFTLRNSVRNLLGPVVGILGQRYGVRSVTVVGGVLAVLGIVLCSVAPDVIWISVFWGGLHGIGVAFANTLFQVTVNQYFVKYRATAAGIALSGACVGSFVFPVLLETLLNTFGLSGTFLLTGGIVMQLLPAAILLTEPPWLKLPPQERIRRKHRKKKSRQLETIEEGIRTRKNSVSDKEVNESFDGDKKTNSKKTPKNNRSSLKKGVENPAFLNSTVDISDKTKSQDLDISSSKKQLRSRTISASEISVIIPVNTEPSITQNVSVLKALLSVCKNPMFHMISISLGTFAMIFDPLMTVIVDYMKDKGLDDHVGKYLISILALGDLVGRLCFGWITDKKYISVPKFMMIIQVIQGACMVLLPLFYAFEVLMGLVVVYGVTSGTTIVMFPILVAKYLASEQSVAIGCIAFFAGIISFGIPPLIGHFRDFEGSYDGMFYITGGMCVITGFLWLFEPILVRFNKEERTLHMEDSMERKDGPQSLKSY